MPLRTLALAVLIPLLTACGITGNFRNDPGYADFGPLQSLDAESDFGLSLGPLPLPLVREAMLGERGQLFSSRASSVSP